MTHLLNLICVMEWKSTCQVSRCNVCGRLCKRGWSDGWHLTKSFFRPSLVSDFFFNIFSTLFFLPSRFFPNFLGPPFVACRHKNKEGVAECPSHNRNSKLQKCFSCFFYIYASWVWIREWCNYGGRHSTGVDESPVVYPARSLDTVPEHHYFQCFYH